MDVVKKNEDYVHYDSPTIACLIEKDFSIRSTKSGLTQRPKSVFCLLIGH